MQAKTLITSVIIFMTCRSVARLTLNSHVKNLSVYCIFISVCWMNAYYCKFQVVLLDCILSWAGVIDELEYARRLQNWCQNGFPELGDKQGIVLSETVKQVSSHNIHCYFIREDNQVTFASMTTFSPSLWWPPCWRKIFSFLTTCTPYDI